MFNNKEHHQNFIFSSSKQSLIIVDTLGQPTHFCFIACQLHHKGIFTIHAHIDLLILVFMNKYSLMSIISANMLKNLLHL